MPPPLEDIAGMVFKRSEQTGAGEFKLDTRTLGTLLALDGRTALGDVARRLNLDMNTIYRIMLDLAKMKLVIRVGKPPSLLEPSLVAAIKSELAKAAGPIGEALLHDVLGELGMDFHRIPKNRAPELVEMLAREIPDQQRRLAFIKVILPALQ
ncbi:MAG: hypothetical protein ACOWWM_21260 [Desulfobacterales bacterium]